MTDFAELVEKLMLSTRFQKTFASAAITDYDFVQLVMDGIKTLYIDLNNEDLFSQEVNESLQKILVTYNITQVEYILNSAMIGYSKLIQSTVNTLYGYSTDALTITNADKPYANIANDIEKLQDRQTELFHKLRASEG